MDSHKNTLLFIDVTTPRPYDPSNIDGPGCGGTEQTMVCLAEGLASTGLFNVVVEQHNRPKGEDYNGKALYTSQGACRGAKWVIVLRDANALVNARERFCNAKIYLYSHDIAGGNLGRSFERGVFQASQCIANICVSQWHRTQTIDVLKPLGYSGQFKMRVIYNPLSEDVVRTGEPYDKNKLMWLASPHKGLDRAFDILSYLVKLNPDFKLYVTNPGYVKDTYPNDPSIKNNVVTLGTLPHAAAISHLSTALCLFYPNTVFPETFGKVMAEANAVACPVITHPIGAAYEILDTPPSQLTDCRNTEKVIKTVMSWYEGCRPIVRGNPKFKLSTVLREWIKLLDGVL